MSDKFSSFFRPGSAAAQAHSVFTNRTEEFEHFQRFTEEHKRYAASIDPLNPDLPRRNILDFYGFGGIGKSTLLHKLQDTVKSTKQVPAATTLIDFQEPTSFGLEDFILALRITAGRLGSVCSAFDVAFSFYWSVVHPGTPLSTYTRNNSILRRAGDKIGLSEEMEKVLTDVASTLTSASGIAVAGTHLAQLIAKQLRGGYRTRHAIASCPILPMFLDPVTVVESLTYLPALLAWDISRADESKLVVFLDTYEQVTEKGRRVESSIQRICYLMPNAMFVIAGRNRLDWDRADLRGALDYVGPDRWPDLGIGTEVSGNRCVLVGELSKNDSDQYLQQRLQVNGAPAIPEAIRNRIIETSNGWPLYLDMAAAYYQELSVTGTHDLSVFDEPFPALVIRIVSDLTADERSVLFSAALFDSFDDALVRVTAGNVSDRTVQNVIGRPYLRREPGSFCPYSLHSALRKVLRADTDFWSTTDWHRAAIRAFDELGRRASACIDRVVLSNLLLQGLRLSHEFDLPIQWLSSAGRTLYRQGGLDPAALKGIDGSAAADLSCLLSVVAMRGRLPFRAWAKSLRECADGKRLTASDSMWAKTLEADALLSIGRIAEATEIYSEVVASRQTPADVASEAKTMFALTLLKRGSFTDLARMATSDPSSVNSPRLLGDVYRSNARWSDSTAQYSSGLLRAESGRDSGLSALFRAELALVEGWTGKTDPSHWADLEVEELEPWSRSAHYLARALYNAELDSTYPNECIRKAEEIATDFEMNDVLLDIFMVRAMVAAMHDDTPGILRERDRILDNIGQRSEYLYRADVVGWWAGYSISYCTAGIQWLDGVEAARSRWIGTLEARKLRVT